MENNEAKRTRLKENKKKKAIKTIFVIIIDFLLICAGLVIFALFHHVLPRQETAEPIKLPGPSATEQPQTEETAEAEQTSPPTQDIITQPEETEQTQADYGMWGEKFADKFTSGEIISTENSYQSKDINITLDKIQESGITYYIADIYIRNIENFKTAFANGTFGRGNREPTIDMAIGNNAIIAISGDYYSVRHDGIVIRNGSLYRDIVNEDVLIMNYDGSLETFSPSEFNIDSIIENGAYQGWSFGPMLLTDGMPMEKFNSSVNPANPRCAIGYFEPGHYCFVLVDGRQPGYSNGITLKGLSQLFYNLGCAVAYNLDGGQSAVMTFDGQVANQPINGGRDISDILYIAEIKG